MAVDFRRHCSKNDVLPFEGGEVVKIRWYRVPDNTPAVPYWHIYGSQDWNPYRPKENPVIGVRPYPDTYDKGIPPDYVGTNGRVCGSAEAWAGVPSPLLNRDAQTNVARCCGVPVFLARPLCLVPSEIVDGRLAMADMVSAGSLGIVSASMPSPTTTPALAIGGNVPQGTLGLDRSPMGIFGMGVSMVESGGLESDVLATTDNGMLRGGSIETEGSTIPGEEVIEMDGTSPEIEGDSLGIEG